MTPTNPSIPTIHHAHKHLRWSNRIPPIQTVPSGTTIQFHALEASNGQITPSSTSADLSSFDASLADPAFGPVYVSGAEPGDVLEVEILALETGEWGWSAIFPGFGLLSAEFDGEPVVKIWRIGKDDEGEEGRWLYFKDGVRVRKRPFLGIMGVAPGDEEQAAEGDGEGLCTIPPRDIGGNMDCRSLTVGSKVYFPVRVPGALFSCGDGHAAQGDGEVCGTAVETSIKATLRLTVHKDRPWVKAPQFECPPRSKEDALADIEEDKGEYATMGLDADMHEATRKAVRSMIEWLVNTKGLTREEAYILTSVAGNLRLSEVVDMPNYGVVMAMPLKVFV